MSFLKEKAPARTGAHEIESSKSMSSNIVPFNFDGHQVRVEMIDGEPWFVLTDLCTILGLSTPARVAERLDPAGVSQTHISSGGQRRQVTIIDEAGMYEAVIRSDKPGALTFRRWITGEVLPQIRKTGSYGHPALTEEQIVHQALQITVRQVKELEAKVSELEPKADYVDTFVTDSDLRIFRNVAKSIGMGEKQLRMDLISRKWIYEESSTRWSEKDQKKVSHTRYSAYSDKTRYFTPVPTHDAPRFRGEVMHTLKITPQGAIAIARLYGIKAEEVELV